MADAPVATIPFEVASQYSSRHSFNVPSTDLSASAPTNTSPVQIPAVGYVSGILLEVTISGTLASGSAVFADDAPFNAIESINLRNAAGVNFIAPVNGYSLYLMNKYGAQGAPGFGPYANPKFGTQYSTTTSDGSAHFFLWLPVVLDPETAYGSIPALASNASYQTEITFAALSRIYSTQPDSATIAVNATVWYFDLPAAADAQGRAQATTPPSDGTSVWQIEQPTVSPGTQLVQSVNVGNVIRTSILTLRDSDGKRSASSWPDLMELFLDNQPRFALRKNEWTFLMERWFGTGGALDGDDGLDSGVFVLPWHTLLGSMAGDPNNTRAQLLTTLNATLMQWRAQDFGSDASKFQMLTEVVTTKDPSYLYGK